MASESIAAELMNKGEPSHGVRQDREPHLERELGHAEGERQQRRQRFTLQIFGHQHGQALVLHELMGLDDVGMVHPLAQASILDEGLDRGARGPLLEGQRLEHHQPASAAGPLVDGDIGMPGAIAMHERGHAVSTSHAAADGWLRSRA
jgi:hypothetical protein